MVSVTYWKYDGLRNLGGLDPSIGQLIGKTYGELMDKLDGVGAFRD